uniref:Disease resistance protein SUMM2-like n=1 Tax=Elaeis guineensis var. tenera TaxID=51953 RepID=A0A8N4EZS9_ELAGV|nr:disease resistance protein SUMM2-like [Elaeis guineensis]
MRKTPKEWQNAITLLRRSKLPQILEKDEDMFPRLKLGYDYLPDDSIRKCFLLCTLWPEEFSINNSELIECWMGHGLIDVGVFNDINEAYESGHAIIGKLKSACLLEPGFDEDTEVKMHDIIGDMARWIASDGDENNQKLIVQSGATFCRSSADLNVWATTKQVTLTRSEIREFPGAPLKCPNLALPTALYVMMWRLRVKKLLDLRQPHQLLLSNFLSTHMSSSLQQLEIAYCVTLEELIMEKGSETAGHGGDIFPTLSILRAYGCDKPKNVTWALKLEYLEEPDVYDCKEMKRLIDDADEADAGTNLAFSGLKAIHLLGLPNLTAICRSQSTFPSLELLVVSGCPALGSLPFNSETPKNKLRTEAMNPMELESIHWAATATKRKKLSVAPTPKYGRSEAVLAQPVVGGSSGPSGAWRKESSMPARMVMPLQSIASGELSPSLLYLHHTIRVLLEFWCECLLIRPTYRPDIFPDGSFIEC